MYLIHLFLMCEKGILDCLLCHSIKSKINTAAIGYAELSCSIFPWPCPIERIIPMASSIFFALKKIHAKLLKMKVTIIWKNSLTLGSILPSETVAKCCLLVAKNIDGMINKACNKPQKINVQFAPCQKPLTKKMMNVFDIPMCDTCGHHHHQGKSLIYLYIYIYLIKLN